MMSPSKAKRVEPEKLRLTKTAVERITAPKSGEVIVWDSDLRGYGVRVSASGRRTYFIYGRTKGGRQIKLKVGVHGAVTAEQARTNAQKLIGQLMAGDDPAAERKKKQEAERQRRDAPTMKELGTEYLSEHAEVKKRPSSIGDDRSMLENNIYPRIGARRVFEVTHKDIETLHRAMRETPHRANRVVSLLSKMFNLAIKWKYRSDNPAKGIERYQEHKRERYLRPDELARLRDVLKDHPSASANAVRLLLLTGARRGEVLGATWDQIDFDHAVWTKPASTTKQKKVHSIPLSPAALAVFEEIKHAADEAQRRAKAARQIRKRSPYVFPSEDGEGHLTEIKKFWASVCRKAKINGVRLHDLRHTFASLLASEKQSLPIIGALLGHSSPTTTARYSHLFRDTTREAAEAAANRLSTYENAKRKGKLVEVKS
jgi:integrase